MRYSHVVFDIDGTLIDSTSAILDGLQDHARGILGRELGPDELARGAGLPAAQALAAMGLDSGDEAAESWISQMLSHWDDVCVFPGVENLLGELAESGITLGAVTAETRSEMERGFATMGLADRLERVVCADDVSAHKPDPAPLLAYLEAEGCERDEVIYVGDQVCDATCAAAAGVDFALACWKGIPERSNVPAVGRFCSPWQLLEWLEREPPVEEREPWLAWARELQAIAQAGLYYTKDVFDRERFEQIRDMACSCMEILSGEEPSRVRDVFANEDGYQTPKMDSRAVLFDEEGRICLVRESDGRWALPGGWVDTGQTVFSNVVKEAHEEAGLDVVPEQLIALEEHNLHNPRPFAWGIAKSFVICRALGGEFERNSETTERGFFSRDRLPELYVEKNTKEQLHMCFEAHDELSAGRPWVPVVD